MTHLVHKRIGNHNDEDSHDLRTPFTDEYSPPFPSTIPLSDDTSQLHLASSETLSSSSGSSAYDHGSTLSLSSTLSESSYLPASSSGILRSAPVLNTVKQKIEGKRKKKKETTGLRLTSAAQRRAYFTSPAHRQDITFGPEVNYNSDVLL
ncbi:hypothetical protein H0H87_006839 [Tephrocybe sp. NHM501043]|nr:hypothetical protein H0H87_006839 [Tephrocybe sp. NHM501043]